MRRQLVAILLAAMVANVRSATARSAETVESLRAKARGVLAQLDGEIAVAGLEEPVVVLRDRWGVPHIYAGGQHDLFFAQGFVAAQDRLFQIDMWRRIAVGETAEVLGPEALVRDRFARLTRYRGDMQTEWTSYAPDTQEIVTAFTNGINAYIDHLGERLPIEFQLLGYKPKKWQPTDCLGRTSVLAVALNLRREVARAELVAKVGLKQARQVMPTDPPLDFAPRDQVDLSGIDRRLLEGYQSVVAPITFGSDGESSNNWAIDGTLSASGKPMLASDPHRAIALPSLRYLVHLNAPGWNVIGGGEPALPGVAIGHNERIAWGFTIVLTDQADLFVETIHPEDADRYRVGDRWERMEIRREKVFVRRGGRQERVELKLRYTRNGPVIYEDRPRRRAYALRWMGSEPGTAAYLASLAVDRAKNWQAFLAAAARWKAPSENLVYADVDGNIGWIAAALTPIRNAWHGLLPVPGASGKYQWQGFLRVDQLPQEHNPARHYVATANHNILPPDYPHEIAYDWVADFRYRRVKERLEAKRRFTLADFRDMQFDHVSIPARELPKLLSRVGVSDESLKPFASLLESWDGALEKSSRAAPLYVLFREELTRAFFALKTPPHLIEMAERRAGLGMMLDELARPTTQWFGKDAEHHRDRLVREAFARAVAKGKETLGSDSKSWTLGKLQRVVFKHPLAGRGAVYAEAFNIGPFASGSGPYAPDQARYNKHRERGHGATYRHVLDLADWDRGLATSAPGQSGQPESPHYADLAPLWNRGEYFPLAFSRKKVESVTRHRLTLRPGP